ncbi:RNB domain-containing ribonuclease [Glutamicibacter endophyticus]|uniref:RNB domain-containing ribonuclease n=1 Tax=Glutamicibacter endophyticus TaxID=1522174 RepID=UPI003AEFFF9F
MKEKQVKCRRSQGIDELREHLARLEDEFETPEEFSEELLRAARQAIAQLESPAHDDTDLPFFTIDPAESTDLDQAMYLERTDDGYRVHYAIADVPNFVRLGTALDSSTRRRGQTYYLPHRKISLHPEVISEDHGSLLPDQTRPALLFSIELDEQGAMGPCTLRHTLIRSREKLDYEGAQAELDSGQGREQLRLLAEIGQKRRVQERERGGASLNLPDQEVVKHNGSYRLTARRTLPLEEANAQISLLTGMAAARMMLEAGVGILRTMPAPEDSAIEEFRTQTELLGHRWDGSQSYGQYLHTLDIADPRQLVIMHRAAALFRGADYQVVNGQDPQDVIQAALAAPYAHVTAPLRRLVDRFGLLTCLLISQGQQLPAELSEALNQVPDLMRASNAANGQISRAAVELVEAYVLKDRVGQSFEAIVLTLPESDDALQAREGNIQLVDEPVTARFRGHSAPGSLIAVRLQLVDVGKRRVLFEEIAGPEE